MKKVIKSINRAEVFTFNRWGRKAYSMFNALKQPVRIGVLLAVYTTVAKPEYVFAQADSTKVSMEYNLDEVEVSAQRAPVAFSQVARIVSVISREEIEAAPVQSIQELLEYALSVDVRQRGVHGVQADISVRGGSSEQTLILLNGISISDPQTGHHALNLPVSLKNIQRIEILEGPAARVFGPNAFSGAINIITSPDGETSVKLDVSGGQHKLADVNVSGNLNTGAWNQFIAFNRMSSDGYIDNTDFKTWNAFYQTELKTKPGKLDFQIGRTNKAFGANSFYSATYPNQYEETKTTFASLKFQSGTKIHLTPSIYWRRNQDRFELFRSDATTWPSWYKGHNYHLTDVFGSNLNAWFASRFGKTAFGAEIRTENVWSNVLGEALTTPIAVPGESGQFFTKSYSRTTISYFAEHSVYLKKLTVSAGAMTNWISDLDFGWNIYPGLDASYALSNHVKIYGSFSTNINTTGIEFSGNIFPEKIWNKPIFLTKLGVNYSYCKLDKGQNDLFSYYILDNLKHKLDLEINHKIWKKLKGSWRVSYQDRNGLRTATDSFSPFWTVNARIMWETPSTEIYAMAANLFDKAYYDYDTVEQPGRWISFGISHQIRFK